MKKVILRTLISIIAIATLAGVGWWRLHAFDDPLVYCQKTLDGACEQWKYGQATNTYPNVEGKGSESFLLLAAYTPYGKDIVRDFGYVPGLRDGDPAHLVMLYLRKKTRRTWHGDSAATVFSEPKWMLIGPNILGSAPDQAWLPEGGSLATTPEFRQRLLGTLEFLRANSRPHWAAVTREHMQFIDAM